MNNLIKYPLYAMKPKYVEEYLFGDEEPMEETYLEKKSRKEDQENFKEHIHNLCKEKAIKLIQEISDSSTIHITLSNFADHIIKVLKEKL